MKNHIIPTSISLNIKTMKKIEDLEITNLSKWVRKQIEQTHNQRKTKMPPLRNLDNQTR